MPWTLTDDDQELYFEVAGDGPPLVFAGGFGGIADVWSAQVDELRDEFTCVTYDLRGYGRSDKPLPAVRYGVERHARDVATVMDAAGIDSAVLVGHSMGGNTMMQLALDEPRRAQALVLAASFAAGAQLVEAAGEFDVLGFIKDSVRRRQARYEFFLSSGATEDVALETTKWPTYTLLGNLESFIAFEARERLGELDLPVLVLHGDADVVAPLDPCGRYLADTLANARLEVLAEGNHCPMIQRPDWFNEHLRTFARSILGTEAVTS